MIFLIQNFFKLLVFIVMIKLSIDDLINTFERLNNKSSDNVSELGEQDAGGGSTGGGGGSTGYPAPTKWNSLYKITRGKANQIGNTKWKDTHTITRGPANTLY